MPPKWEEKNMQLQKLHRKGPKRKKEKQKMVEERYGRAEQKIKFREINFQGNDMISLLNKEKK